jgi:hypothetical protein
MADLADNVAKFLKSNCWQKTCDPYGNRDGCGATIYALRVVKTIKGEDGSKREEKKFMAFDADLTPHWMTCQAPSAVAFRANRKQSGQGYTRGPGPVGGTAQGPADSPPTDDDLPF